MLKSIGQSPSSLKPSLVYWKSLTNKYVCLDEHKFMFISTTTYFILNFNNNLVWFLLIWETLAKIQKLAYKLYSHDKIIAL